MMKRFFALLVCFVLLISMIPAPALATESGQEPNPLTVTQEAPAADKSQQVRFLVELKTGEDFLDTDFVSLMLGETQLGEYLTEPDENGVLKTEFSCSWNDLTDGTEELKAEFWHADEEEPYARETCEVSVAVEEPDPQTTTYTLTYDGNGGGDTVKDVPETQTGETAVFAVSNKEPIRVGYTFKGWAKEADATEPMTETAVTIPEGSTGMTLYAVWEETPETVTYTLTYDGNGGADTVKDVPETQTGETAVFTVSNKEPIRVGYTFKGWAKEADATEPMTETAVTIPEGSTGMTLYAVWEMESEVHLHVLGKITGQSATCTEAGILEHWKCTDPTCGKLFSDENGTTEITDITIPAGHTLTDVALQEPTYTAPGIKAHKHCSVCDKNFIGTEEVTDELLVIPQLIIVTGTCADVSRGAMVKADDGLGNVTLDLNSTVFVAEAAGTILSVKLPVISMETLQSLTIHMAHGSVVFDQKALAEVAEQAGDCSQVTLTVEQLAVSSLNLWQRYALEKYEIVKVVNISLKDCRDQPINTMEAGGFGLGSVKLTLSGITKTKNNIYYKYISEKGDLKGISGTYNATKQTGTMHLLNTGDHAVVRLKADTTNPATGDNSNIHIWTGVMAVSAVALVVVIILMTRKPGKKK